MKKLHALMFALGLVFLGFLIWKIGFKELWHELTVLGWGLIPVVLSEGLAEFFHTISWRYCLSGPLRRTPLLRLFQISMAGYAINYLTPTATVGGEVSKAALLAHEHRGPEAVTAVLIGKLSFALAHLLFVIIGSLVVLRQIVLPRALWLALLTSSALLLLAITTFLLIQKYGKLGALIRWLVTRRIGGKALRKLAGEINHVDDALKIFYREQPWGLPLSILWHLIGYSVGIFTTWYFLYLLADGASLTTAAGIWFLGMWFDLVGFAVPLNLGVLEGSRILAFRAVGYTSLLGMTSGMAIRIAQMFWAGFGMINYAVLIRRQSGDKTDLKTKHFNPIHQGNAEGAK